MSFQPDNTESPFLATATTFPQEAEELNDALTQNYQRSANAINAREIAFYQSFESPTGQQWPTFSYLQGVPYAFNMTFRITVSIPALVAGLNVIPHQIPGVTAQYVFTKMLGAIGNGAIWHSVPNNDIHLSVDAVNVNLTVPAAYAGFTGFVILEYLKTT